MRRWQDVVPTTTLGRVRLGAVALSVVSLITETGQIGMTTGSPAWDLLAKISLGLLGVGFVVTYVLGRTWLLDPIVLPALVAVAGSALKDPIATIGLTMVLLVVQSLYGSFRSWAVRSFFGMLSLPAALIAAPTPVGAIMDLGRSAQLVPQVVLVTALTRAIYSALRRQEQAAARDALLAQAGSEVLAATDIATVHRIALETSQAIMAFAPGVAVVLVARTDDGLVVAGTVGEIQDLTGHVLPLSVLSEPASALAASAPRIRHWQVEELLTGQRYRLIGGVHRVPEPVHDAFRTLGTQVRLGEANLRSHAELDHQANHDSLTQLPTRAKFFRELINAVDNSTPGAVALLNIDLDDFKQVNDVYGHPAGDELLVRVAERIAEAGGAQGLAGRLGGDEFVLMLTGLKDPVEAEQTAELLCSRLVQPMRLTAATVRVGASIGVALSAPQTTAAELTRRADIAMYSAKARGKNRVEIFNPVEHGEVARHRTLEDQLPYAIERGEIHVYYQPYLDLSTGSWSGVEALVQWQHPTFGAVDCRELLNLAERTGDLALMTAYFLRTVAEQLAPMPVGAVLRIGMNLSAHQLFDPRFADTVLDTLAQCGLEPSRLALEIVESEHIDDARARRQLDRIAACGVRIALDDFGTGYVSLASLRAFPIHQLKIDGAFLDGDPAALDLVLSVGNLLGTETVVQGVTTGQQLDRLRRTSATAGQGPLIAPIMTAAALTTLLTDGRAPIQGRA